MSLSVPFIAMDLIFIGLSYSQAGKYSLNISVSIDGLLTLAVNCIIHLGIGC